MQVTPSLPWQQGIVQGLRMARRERHAVSTVALLAGALLLAQLLLITSLSLHRMTGILTQRVAVRINLEDNVSQQDLQQLYAELNVHEAVSVVEFTSKDELLAQQRERDPELTAFMDEYGLQNPFQDGINLVLRSEGDIQSLITLLNESRWNDMIDPSAISHINERRQEVAGVLTGISLLRSAAAWLTALALLILLGIILELVRRKVLEDREEWVTQRLIGASRLNLILPVATTMSVLLLSAFAIALLLLIPLLLFLSGTIKELLSGLPAGAGEMLFRSGGTMMPYVLLAELIALPLIAALGTMLGMNRIRSV